MRISSESSRGHRVGMIDHRHSSDLRLIVAAPDLLAASKVAIGFVRGVIKDSLNESLDDLEDDAANHIIEGDSTVRQLEAAITLAEGPRPAP